MAVDSDYISEVFLALVTVGPSLAIVAYLVDQFYERREARERESRQRARSFRQNKQRLRVGRG
jgi:hypothetical protein